MKLARYLTYDIRLIRTGWDLKHNRALANPLGVEIRLVGMLEGLEMYIEEYQFRNKQEIFAARGLNDGLVKITKGVRLLLEGEIGRLDRATIDDILTEFLLNLDSKKV